jgi:hypothetical protein
MTQNMKGTRKDEGLDVHSPDDDDLTTQLTERQKYRKYQCPFFAKQAEVGAGVAWRGSVG